MKIIVVGATGTIGRAVVGELKPRHEIVAVGHRGGEVQVDITSTDSIRKMYDRVGAFDALVSATGSVHFGEFMEMTEKEYDIGLRSKLMGQVNLVLLGRDRIADGGSFTLTSGILGEDPIRFGSSASMVNGALEGFVLGASIEIPRGIRINLVSPTVIEEAMPEYGPYFRGFDPVPAAKAALAYSKSVEGLLTGKVLKVYGAV